MGIRKLIRLLVPAACLGLGTLLAQAPLAEAAMAPPVIAIAEAGGFVAPVPSPITGNIGDSLQTTPWDTQSDGCCIDLALVSGPASVDVGGTPINPHGAPFDGCCGGAPTIGPFTTAGSYQFSLVWVSQCGTGEDCPPTQNTVYFTVNITSPLPTASAQCKDGGWQAFGVFKNQGDCVSFVASKGKNQPG